MQKQRTLMTTKTLTYSALMAALSVVLARIFGMMPDESSRFSIEAVPIFLAGMLCGPIPGALVGFTADFVGCLFSPFGYNPIFCIPPILYGLCGGLFRHFLAKGVNIPRLALSFLLPVLLGSVLYQSAALAAVYYKDNFLEGLILKLTTRSVQFAIVYVLDVMVVFLLFRSNMFTRLGIWPPVRRERKFFNERQ